MQAVSYLEISDKLLHFAGYLLLGFLPALHESPRGIAMFAAAAACIGILIEFAQQSAGGGRSLEVADMVADLAGIASGVLLGFRLRSTGATRRAGGASH
jgi:VanZ family protein